MSVTGADPTASVSTRPALVPTIVAAARAAGADPVLMVAVAMRESSLNWDAVGDNGTSFGPFQHHRGGALGNHSPAWAMSPAGVEERAQAFRGARNGTDAARIQRPANPTAYARTVDGNITAARALVAAVDTAPVTAGPPAPSSSNRNPAAAAVAAASGAVSGVTGAVRAGAGVVSNVFSFDWIRRLVVAGIIVAGGVALVVTGGYGATKGGAA